MSESKIVKANANTSQVITVFYPGCGSHTNFVDILIEYIRGKRGKNVIIRFIYVDIVNYSDNVKKELVDTGDNNWCVVNSKIKNPIVFRNESNKYELRYYHNVSFPFNKRLDNKEIIDEIKMYTYNPTIVCDINTWFKYTDYISKDIMDQEHSYTICVANDCCYTDKSRDTISKQIKSGKCDDIIQLQYDHLQLDDPNLTDSKYMCCGIKEYTKSDKTSIPTGIILYNNITQMLKIIIAI